VPTFNRFGVGVSVCVCVSLIGVDEERVMTGCDDWLVFILALVLARKKYSNIQTPFSV
jgi:hypothetical protein